MLSRRTHNEASISTPYALRIHLNNQIVNLPPHFTLAETGDRTCEFIR